MILAAIVGVVAELDYGSGIEFLSDGHVAEAIASSIDLTIGGAGNRQAGRLLVAGFPSAIVAPFTGGAD